MLKILGELCSSSKCLHAFPKLHNHPIHSMFLQSQKYLSNSAFLTNIYMLFENHIAIHSNAMSYMVNCNDSVLSLVCGICKVFVWSYLEALVLLMNNTIPAIGLDLGQTKMLVECTRRWLKKLGYGLTEAKKAMYTNGYERPGIVEYCKAFLEKMKESKQ